MKEGNRMTNTAIVKIANVRYSVEKLPTSGKFFDTAKAWFDGTAGDYDAMKALNKLCTLCGWAFLKDQTKRYMDGCAILRVIPMAVTLHRTYTAIRQDKPVESRFQRKVGFTHQIYDFSAMLCYAKAFLTKGPTTSAHAGNVLIAARDVTDVLSSSTQLYNGVERRSKLATASPVLQRANNNAIFNAFLKLAKAVTAAVASVFACLALTGAVLVSPVIVGIALASVFLNIATYYHKNYYCDTFLKIE